MTIQFKYTSNSYDDYGSCVDVVLNSEAEELAGVVEAFKTFLSHCGYHSASIERVLYVAGDSQGFARGNDSSRMGDGNPRQGDFFDDTDEESGV